MLQMYLSNVSDVLEIRCKCHVDAAKKVDRDVAHVAMAIHVCFKCMFYVFQTYVLSVSSGCCKSRSGCCIYMHVASECFRCFIHMLQVFHLDVAYVLQLLHTCFQIFF